MLTSKGKRLKKIAFSAFALILFFILVNLIVKPFIEHPAAKLYEGLYAPCPDRMFELKPGATINPRVGVFGPYEDKWKKANLKYEIRINSLGFRDIEFKLNKEAGVIRVVCLGDSSTFGWDIKEDEAYPKIIEKFIHEKLPSHKVEVLNFGIPGYSSWQGRLFLAQRVWEFEPDILVVAYGRNDELDTAFAPTKDGINRTDKELMPDDETSMERANNHILARIKTLPIYRYLLTKLAKYPGSKTDVKQTWGDKNDKTKRRATADQYQENLRWIIAKGKKRNVPVILLGLGMFLEPYRKALIEVGVSQEVPAYDMFDIFFNNVERIKTDESFSDCRKYVVGALGEKTVDESPGGWLYFSTDFGHPNACGHIVVAETIIKDVLSILQNEN